MGQREAYALFQCLHFLFESPDEESCNFILDVKIQKILSNTLMVNGDCVLLWKPALNIRFNDLFFDNIDYIRSYIFCYSENLIKGNP